MSTILLVEDDPNDLLLAERAFRKANLPNAALQHVADGDAAVSYLAGEGDYADRDRYPLPVLILLDLKLPRRSGLEVLSWMREQPGINRLPVVMLTSSKEEIDINRAYDVGANSYLVKPFGFDALVDIVNTLNQYWLRLNQSPEIQ